LRTHKPRKHDYEDGHHQHFSNGRESTTHCPKRNYGQQEGRQRSNVAWILPLQPRRAMRTNKPSPLVHIQEKRGNNVMLANGALRHRGYPFRSCAYCAALLPPRQWNEGTGSTQVSSWNLALKQKIRAGALGQISARSTPAL